MAGRHRVAGDSAEAADTAERFDGGTAGTERSAAYASALQALEARTDWRRLPGSALEAGQERVGRLLAKFDHPERKYDIVHIAGTVGKGSVAAMIERALRSAGNLTGLYTQPHLHSWRERIRLNGYPLGLDGATATLQAVLAGAELLQSQDPMYTPTEYELGTVAAIFAFEGSRVDWAVLETGLGGRLDATNVVTPKLVVLTPIGLDHTQVLGATIAEIAAEKAAIIKPGVPVVSAAQAPEALAVIERVCADKGARLTLLGRDVTVTPAGMSADGEQLTYRAPGELVENYTVSLMGRHQVENAGLALAALHVLRTLGVELPDEALHAGLAQVVWPGRLQVVRTDPMVIVDGAHNGPGARVLAEFFIERTHVSRLTFVLGISADKDAAAIIKPLARAVRVALHRQDEGEGERPKAGDGQKGGLIFTQAEHPRAAEPTALLALAESMNLGVPLGVAPTVAEALDIAIAGATRADAVCATGSLFVVAEAMTWGGAPGIVRD